MLAYFSLFLWEAGVNRDDQAEAASDRNVGCHKDGECVNGGQEKQKTEMCFKRNAENILRTAGEINGRDVFWEKEGEYIQEGQRNGVIHDTNKSTWSSFEKKNRSKRW